jgi:hypothetical protein
MLDSSMSDVGALRLRIDASTPPPRGAPRASASTGVRRLWRMLGQRRMRHGRQSEGGGAGLGHKKRTDSMQAEDEVSAIDQTAQDVRGNCPLAEHPISALRFGGRYGP